MSWCGPALRSQNDAAIQRMVVATASVDAIDRIIAADIAFQSRRAGGETLSLSDIEASETGTHAIGGEEWFVICGHGDPTSMDGVPPGRLSAGLKRVTNYEKTGGVYLSACNTATPGDTGKSFSGNFREQFLGGRKGPEPHIIGATGYKINDFESVSGEEQVAVPTAAGDQAGALQDQHWTASGLSGAINAPLKAASIDDVVSAGRALLKNDAFMQFFRNFVGALKASNLLEPDQLRDQHGRSINLT